MTNHFQLLISNKKSSHENRETELMNVFISYPRIQISLPLFPMKKSFILLPFE